MIRLKASDIYATDKHNKEIAVALSRAANGEAKTYSVEKLPDASLWQGGNLMLDDGTELAVRNDRFELAGGPVSCRRSYNQFTANGRYSVPSIFGTGSSSPTDLLTEQGIRDTQTLMDSGSAGRVWFTATLNLDVVGFYAFSFEVLEQSLGLADDCGLAQAGGTVVIDYGSLTVAGTDIAAGGVGRYCAVFRVSVPGTIVYRLGVGINSNKASRVLAISQRQIEKLNPLAGLVPSLYVYPEYAATTSSKRSTSIDGNKKVTEYFAEQLPTKPFTHVLFVGDSRTDEDTDIAAQLDGLLSLEGGVCHWHAAGGWKVEDVIGPTTLHGVTFTIDKALRGVALRRTISTNGDEQAYNIQNGQKFDTLIIGDLGVNNAIAGDSAAEILSKVDILVKAAEVYGMRVIITDNNPFKAAGSWTAGRQVVLEEYNGLLLDYCARNGHSFVQGYSAVGDSTDPDKLSDGADTSPDYSQDGIHMNAAGNLVYAQLIKDVADETR